MKKNLSVTVLLLAGSLLSAVPEADEAARLASEGKFVKQSKQESSVPYFLYNLSAPRPGRPFSGYFIAKNPIRLRMILENGFTQWITFSSRPQLFTRGENKTLKLPKRKFTVPHSCIEINGLPLKRFFTRPNLALIDDSILKTIKPESFPDASRTIFHLRMEASGSHTSVYINGSYAGAIQGRVASLEAILRTSEEALDLSRPEKEEPFFERINLDQRSRSGLAATLNLDSLPSGIPLRTDVVRALDLRKAAPAWPSKEKKYHPEAPDLARSAFDAIPSSFLFSVPAQRYSRAYVLCSPIPGGTPAFKLAMSRFAPYGRAALAIPEAKADLSVPSDRIRKCGSAELELDGRKVPVPVYLVELPLDHGAIQDLIHDDPFAALPFTDYLDMDFRGPGERVFNPAPGQRSGVAVYAVTLEKVRADMSVGQTEKGNIFHNGEKPVIPVDIIARMDGVYTLSWRFFDTEKKTADSGSESFTLKKGESKRFSVPAGVKGTGWFGAELALSDGEKTFSTFRTALAILPRDTRTAKGVGSPYSVWFFGSGHYLRPDVNTIGPILFKMGVRSIGCSTELPEADWSKWDISLSQIPNVSKTIYTDQKILSDDPEVWRKMEADIKRVVAQYVRRFPRCRRVLLCHESYRGGYKQYPESLFGRAPEKFDEKRETLERARIKAATEFCRIIRRDFPQLKIVFGNSCYAQGMIESFAARGFDPSLVDFIGCEGVGAWDPPESVSTWNPAGSSLILRTTARLMKFNQPLTATFEWTCRTSNLFEQGPADPHGQLIQQAQWMIRDFMTAHAFGYDNIPVGGVTDTGTTYNDGIVYGATGLFTRTFDPKPIAVAVATATRILDNVRFTHALKGAVDVHLFAFKRADGKNIYTLWTPDGSAQCAIRVKGAGQRVASEDLFGRPSEYEVRNGTILTEATESLRYFISDGEFESYHVEKRVSSNPPRPEKPLAEIKTKADDFTCDTAPDARIDGLPLHDRYFHAEYVVPATVADTVDSEAGKCVSVKFDLSKLPKDSWNHGGYVLLRFKQPVVIPPDVEGIGMRVKGNGSLGRLAWEVEDSQGGSFLSDGVPRDGGRGLNILYRNEFDFTGWRFLHMALDREIAKPRKWFSLQWSGKRNAAMKRPVKLTGILLSTSQKLPRIFEFLPVENQEIRFADIVFFRTSAKKKAPETQHLADRAGNGKPAVEKQNAETVIANGDFEILVPPSQEQFLDRWSVPGGEFPANWLLHPTAGKKVQASASVLSEGASSGKHFFRIEGRYVAFKQKMTTSGVALRVTFKARGTGLVCVSICGKENRCGPVCLRVRPKPDEWNEFSGVVSSDSCTPPLFLFIQQGASKGYIEVDDVRAKWEK